MFALLRAASKNPVTPRICEDTGLQNLLTNPLEQKISLPYLFLRPVCRITGVSVIFLFQLINREMFVLFLPF
jgi:hypothetical protein